ncbi:MAG: hypothetical protein WC511_02965 [Candidatus Pacearchaeota archaeon]
MPNLSQIIFNGITVLPMRPEYSALSFSSADVPHGTDSVYYKAAKILIQEHQQNIPLPVFTAEEIADKKTAKVAALSLFVVLDGEGNPTGKTELKLGSEVVASYTQAQFTSEIKELRRIYLVDGMPGMQQEVKAPVDAQGNIVPEFDNFGQEIVRNWKFADDAAAYASILEGQKVTTASFLVDKAIEQCLEVPTLSAEFKALFTLAEVPEMQ